MDGFEIWQGQDVLKLSVEQWILLLKNPDIFDENTKELIYYVYAQHNKQSTASDIGKALNNVSQQKITASNRSVAKKIYKLYDKDAPPNSEGGKRYWNVLFDGVKENPLDKNGHFFWRLRDNLIRAIDLTE